MSEITADDVAAYLQQHPDFFHDHLDLLERLSIPHPSGVAVSLVAKQLELLRNKHLEQENQLTELIEIARSNDVSFFRLHQLTLALLNAATLKQVVSTLEQVLTEYSQNISRRGLFVVTLEPLRPDTEVDVAISLPFRSEPFTLSGRVVRTVTAESAIKNGEQPGVGIALDKLPANVALGRTRRSD